MSIPIIADAVERADVFLDPLAGPVNDRDGRKVGHLAAVDADGIVVERGLIALLRSRVPFSNVDCFEHGRVTFGNLAASDAHALPHVTAPMRVSGGAAGY